MPFRRLGGPALARASGRKRTLGKSATASGKRLYLDVGVFTGKGSKVVRVTGRDDAAAEANRSRDNERVDGMARVKPVAIPEAASYSRRCLSHRDRSYAASQHTIKRGVSRSTAIRFGQHSSGHAYGHSHPSRGRKHVAQTPGRLSIRLGVSCDF